MTMTSSRIAAVLAAAILSSGLAGCIVVGSGPVETVRGMAVQVGASCLQKEHGGKGVLLGGVPGTRRGRVVIPVSYTHLTLPTKRIV